MEAFKFTTFIVAIIMISTLFTSVVVAQDAAVAPTPEMQSAGVTLQFSGLVAVIASLAALQEMEAYKFTTLVMATIMISSLFATVAVAQDAAAAPTPEMQSAGATLQFSGFVAVIASLAALLF
ncbi:Inner membrane metabolite transport protein YdjE [Bienertia sinuspersici]